VRRISRVQTVGKPTLASSPQTGAKRGPKRPETCLSIPAVTASLKILAPYPAKRLKTSSRGRKTPSRRPTGAFQNVPKRPRWGAAVAVQNEITTSGARSNERLKSHPCMRARAGKRTACARTTRRTRLDTLHIPSKAPSVPVVAFPMAFRLLTYTGARNGATGAQLRRAKASLWGTGRREAVDPVLARLAGDPWALKRGLKRELRARVYDSVDTPPTRM
jgi:hypothetical protein